MTSILQNRINIALALAIPAAAFGFLTSSSSQTMAPPAVGLALGLGTLWLATVVALNRPRHDRANGIDRVTRLNDDPLPAHTATPSYVVDVSRPVKPWRWTSVLLAPIEVLALAWSAGAILLLIMVPIGLALASALWLGRRIGGF